jgi:hypothetical protein
MSRRGVGPSPDAVLAPTAYAATGSSKRPATTAMIFLAWFMTSPSSLSVGAG